MTPPEAKNRARAYESGANVPMPLPGGGVTSGNTSSLPVHCVLACAWNTADEPGQAFPLPPSGQVREQGIRACGVGRAGSLLLGERRTLI